MLQFGIDLYKELEHMIIIVWWGVRDVVFPKFIMTVKDPSRLYIVISLPIAPAIIIR